MLTAGWRFSTARARGLTLWRASCPWGPPWPWWWASMTSSVSIQQSVRSITAHSNHVMRQSGSSDMRQLSFSPDHSHGTLGPVSDAGQCQWNGDELSLTRREEYFSLWMINLLLKKACNPMVPFIMVWALETPTSQNILTIDKSPESIFQKCF